MNAINIKWGIIIWVLHFSIHATAQVAGQRKPIPIQNTDGVSFSDAGVGGMNNPQLSEIDLNRDGKKDLVVFDRAGDVILPYINHGTAGQVHYTFAPQYISVFPTTLKEWVLLRDFNGDGIADIFTHSTIQGIFGIDVYQGSWTEANGWSFEKVKNYHNDVDALSFQSPNDTELEIYVTAVDIPAVVDVDGDNDLDILTFNQAGTKMEWYKNMSQEKGYGADSLYFELADECWGKFIENGTSSEIELSSNGVHCADMNPRIIAPSAPRHAGSTTAAWDNDGDGDLELLIGDLSNNHVAFMNSSSSGGATPWFNEIDPTFPNNSTSADFPTFLAAFVLDLNNDNRKDIVITPNKEGISANVKMMWRYENTASSGAGVFTYQENDFLVGQCLDVGQSSKPVFIDYNDDGLQDIIIGTDGYYNGSNFDTRLILLENQGTSTQPIFKIVNEDWLSISSLNKRRLSPTVGDIDGDGDEDILIGDNSGGLIYIENQNGTFSITSNAYENIQGGQKCSPAMMDLNGDGLMDIVTGFAQGGLNYFENIGTTNNPSFNNTATTTALGGVNVSVYGVGSAAPQFFKEDGENTWKLLVGSYHNDIHLYNNISLDQNFTKTATKYGNIIQGQETGIDLADIDGDGYFEMVVGNRRGGLAFYDTDFIANKALNNTDISNTPQHYFTPNPTKDRIEWSGGEEVLEIHVWSMDGRKLFSTKGKKSISLQFLPPSVYLAQVITKKGSSVTKIIKQ